MKQLIFTFFAIIFCYSVFFDNDKKAVVVDDVNYLNLDAPSFINTKSDTMTYYAFPLLEYNKATSLLESSKIYQTPFITR
ncbi:MAG: hypothetical protein LBS80_01550 [Tannerella sp.]|jgi:hypothetical protein|nr:hypothetical protein [Tannerella sp.]